MDTTESTDTTASTKTATPAAKRAKPTAAISVTRYATFKRHVRVKYDQLVTDINEGVDRAMLEKAIQVRLIDWF
jgi:hypothetical protein